MNANLTSRSYRANHRHAAVLICVLACLAIATALSTAMVRKALTARREMQTQHQVCQAELLLTAGVQRALHQLQADAEYAGEMLDLSDLDSPSIDSAQVEIETTSSEESDERMIRVTAQLSTAGETVVRRTYRFSLDSIQSSNNTEE